jgi:glyoxylase-like metal-dependent hydrolase (beta-lactamase superfamily II)
MSCNPDAIATTGATHEIAAGVRRVVAPNAGPLTGPGTNTYVVGESAPIVIDPGPGDEQHLRRVVAACLAPPTLIVCTHSHPDHSPGAAALAAEFGIPVLGRPAPDDGYQDPSYLPTRILEDGDCLPGDVGVLRALHTPGHASNHVCLLLESEGLLFTGDHLMSGSTVVILPPDGSMREYLRSLERLLAEPLRALAPGHGSRIGDACAEIERVIAHRLARERRIVESLAARGPATVVELLPDAYRDVPVALHLLARHSLLAHLIKLVEDGRARRDGDRFVAVAH